jgi:tetratricopeptide (TPR) repeat protein
MVRPEYLDRLKKISKLVWEKGRKEEAISDYLREIGYKKNTPYSPSGPAKAFAAAKLSGAQLPSRTTAQAEIYCIDVHTTMATVLAEMERFDEAAAAHAVAAFVAPDAALTHEAMGKILLNSRDSEGAVNCFRKALEIDPGLLSALNNLGVALRSMGRFEEAAACFDQMIQLRPDLAMGYSNLASMGKLDADQAEAQRLLALLDQPDVSITDRIAIGFALGDAFDSAGRFDEAFTQYAMANSSAKRQRAGNGDVYDRKMIDEQARLIVETFTAEFFRQRSAWGDPSEVPVFIVGMPRSGTTLVQQIAASHPQICGAGELRDIFDIASSFRITNLKSDAMKYTPAKINAAARNHLQRLQSLDPKALRVIDKMPDNVYRLGLIQLLFPKARVILCRRDPRDTCLSCYFQWFSIGNIFAFDLADCGHQHLATDRIAAHWRDALPLPMLEMQYEELVADLEGQSRRMIKFLGLPWNPACLEFHRTPTTVQTASAWQVRQPLYQKSVGRWRNYEKHLGPLLNELNRQPSGMR